ncbi:MAG: helix-turn-helix transcriptional regulator [Oscillospiraceae bacterium]|nr:helix-turn-helix transcriptional regulator [Oscillospiraceae bacterium]
MDRRVTIEELAHRYLINPTTLKTVFKEVYGSSLAAHMKEHRMERAAALLRETDLSVAEIAGQVGYESQSKFTAAFKEQFGQLPKEYRRN